MSSTSLAIVLHQVSNQDELFMKQTLRFSETLRDLKNLRKQLYSAADYFETSYDKDEHKDVVIETLKDYAMKAVVNTVDHLGSVSDKFNGFLTDNTNHFSTTDLRLRCLEQRMKSCREFIDQSGTYQQLLVIESPQYHKRYFFPDEGIEQSRRTEHRNRNFSAGDDSRRFTSAVRSTIRENPTRQVNKTGNFSFSAIPYKTNNNSNNNKTPSKRSISPMRFPLLRSGSLLKRSFSPSKERKPALAEPRRAMSVSRNPEIERRIMEIEKCSRKGKSVMFKALMSLNKSRKETLLC